MKFETPLVKFMVTADGPACFDISNEMSEVVPAVKGPCDCLCICMSRPIECLCECLCVCPCKCMTTCECMTTCSCKCECPAPPSWPVFDDKVSVSAQAIAFGSKFMLRRESFGGLLFNKESFSSYLCNHSAFEILLFIESQRDKFSIAKISELLDHLRNVFDEVPNNVEIIVLAFIRGCAKQTFVEGI